MNFQCWQKNTSFDILGAALGEHNQPHTCQHILIQVLILTGEQVHLPLRPTNRKGEQVFRAFKCASRSVSSFILIQN